MRRALVLIVGLLLAPGAAAQDAPTVVASAGPEQVAVTVYRDPNRRGGREMDLEWLQGFALVTETRTVTLPAGPAVLRFEGVAGGIVPASAIVTGLPGGTIEKNRDARLLSPASLVTGELGRRVTLRRTDRATGRVREEEAEVVAAGAEQGVVLRTPAGVESLRCSGLPETLVHAGVSAGLSAKPVLSVTTASPAGGPATVTLSYLASGFDWTAAYVATVRPDGRTLDLHGWMTLANGNREAFPDAEVQAVAGRLNRAAVREVAEAAAELELRCYPLGTTTSDLPTETAEEGEEIIVTGSRVLQAAFAPPPPPPAPMAEPPPPEDLGDLKLYRVPERVTVSADGQKQVALLARAGVPFERVYRVALPRAAAGPPTPTRIALRMRNEKARGLGLALPAGSSALYQKRRGGGRLLAGTGTVADTAEGQRFRLDAGLSRQVLVGQQARPVPGGGDATVVATNAKPYPAVVEVRIGSPGDVRPGRASSELARVDGVWTWTVTVPANGRATLTYSVDQ
jgi:hypothetical protein